jgi:ParB family transcriptional regulator, chromosome partitioning protein
MEFRLIPLDLIRPSPNQPRQAVERSGVEELAQSIRDSGILQPIRVRLVGSHFEIITGERRWIAAKCVNLREIPALIVEADDDRAFVEALIENIQREELNAVDRAKALKRLRVTLGLQSWDEVGQLIGISRIHVHRLLNVARLPERIQEDIEACASAHSTQWTADSTDGTLGRDPCPESVRGCHNEDG